MLRLLVGVMVLTSVAHAQSATTGTIEGRVVDGGKPVAEVEVLVNAGRELRSTVTATDGTFRIATLVPDEYLVWVQGMFARAHVGLGVTRLELDLTTFSAARSPFDPATAAQRFEANRAYLDDVPAVGRTYDAVVGAGPDAVRDAGGIAFAGNTSLDNRYFVDGADSTDLRTGATGTFLPSELVRGVTVTTGYGIEYGGSTGALITAVLPSGTDELHGSVFGSMSPSLLAAGPARLGRASQTIDISSPSYASGDFGASLAGPIVTDRMWFFVGAATQLGLANYTRTIDRQTDCRITQADGSLSPCRPEYADGIPDIDPKTRFPIVDPVDSEVRTVTTHSSPIVAKVDLALRQSQASLSAIVVPGNRESPELVGEAATGSRVSTLTSDLVGHWISRLHDDKITIDAQLAWHRGRTNSGSLDPTLDTRPLTYVTGVPFSQLDESAKAKQACSNAYPMIDSCPVELAYPTGGPGLLQHDLEDRESARAAITDRIGDHTVEVGGEFTAESTRTARVYSGGELDSSDPGLAGLFDRTFFVNLEAPSETDPRFDHMCSATEKCQVVGGDVNAPGSTVLARSNSWAAFLGDTWRPRPDLTIEGGLRYEAQHLHYPDDLAGHVDPITNARDGNLVLSFDNNFAPRLGIVFDPTQEGRAKVFAHWGRYFEEMPTTLVADAFSRSGFLVAFAGAPTILQDFRLGVDPDLKAGYDDELVAGGAFEPIAGLALEASWKHRRLGRVVEDVAISDSNVSYELTNPGHGAASTTDLPTHDYDAIELSISRHVSTNLRVTASYVYSRTIGNYTGTLDGDDLDFASTHDSPQFDSTTTIANRFGALPEDRPHSVKLDGVYTLPLSLDSQLVLGARFRALSGTPKIARSDDVLLLPRGALGRTDFVHALDLHVAYHRHFPHCVGELFVDVINVYNDQAIVAVDSIYPSDTTGVTPISGGGYADLIWLRQGNGRPVTPISTFGQTTSRASPVYGTLGARVRF